MFRRNAESRGHRPRDRGTHVVGANLSQEGWGAQALLALARQLTPEAHERGFPCGFARFATTSLGSCSGLPPSLRPPPPRPPIPPWAPAATSTASRTRR